MAQKQMRDPPNVHEWKMGKMRAMGQSQKCTDHNKHGSIVESEDSDADEFAIENCCEAEDFFDRLRASFKASSHVNFYATYPVKKDPLISPKQHVTMAIQEIWQLTGYHFIVKDNKVLKTSHRSHFWRSQDEAHKKKAKPSEKPGVKHRDHVGMKQYP
ncbi:hypothetical protein L208DRAFT_1383291, partial [Tricholoma matsutake]